MDKYTLKLVSFSSEFSLFVYIYMCKVMSVNFVKDKRIAMDEKMKPEKPFFVLFFIPQSAVCLQGIEAFREEALQNTTIE